MSKRKEIENDKDDEQREKQYTKEELERLYKQDLYEICLKRKIGVGEAITTIDDLIKRILEQQQQQQQEEEEITTTTIANTINDDDDDDKTLEYGYTLLPWRIIKRILVLVYNDSNICTCVYSDRLKDLVLERDEYALKKGVRTFTYIQMQPQIKQQSPSRQDMCPTHQYYYDMGYTPSINFGNTSNQKDDSKRWKRESLALVSKRVFELVSTTLYTDIVMRPTEEMWNHINNKYCIVKRPTTLTVLDNPHSTNYLMSDDQTKPSRDLFSQVQKINIKGKYLTKSVDKIIPKLLPNLTSIILDRKVKPPVVNALLTSFNNLTSITLSKTFFSNKHLFGDGPKVKYATLLQPGTSITKIVLPTHFDWNTLDARVKMNLRVVSVHHHYETGYPELKQEDFPQLEHIHIEEGAKKKSKQPVVPETVWKFTLIANNYRKQGTWFTNMPDASETHDTQGPWPITNMPHAKVLRFKGYKYALTKNHHMKNYFGLDQSIISKIIVYSPNDIVDSQVTRFKEIGFQYTGSTLKGHSLKKLSFKLIDKNNNNSNSILESNNNNNNNSILDSSYNNGNSRIFPNYIIRKIIGMVWYARNRCTCIYGKDYLYRIEQQGLKSLEDQEMIEQYFQVKNQCAVHFSTTKPFTPLYHTMVESNRSRLQLTLISKDIFEYIAFNFFNNISSSYIYPPRNSKYSVLKTIQSITCFNAEQPQVQPADRNNVTRIIAPLISYCESIPMFRSLSVLDMRDTVFAYGHWRASEVLRLCSSLNGLPITKLYLSSIHNGPENYAALPNNVKQSLRSISVNFSLKKPYRLDEYPNLTSLDITVSSLGFTLFQLPNTITKIISKRERTIEFLPLNTSVATFKLYADGKINDDKNPIDILKQLSPIKHVTTAIVQIKSPPSESRLSFLNGPDFNLCASVSKPPTCFEEKVIQLAIMILSLQKYFRMIINILKRQQDERSLHMLVYILVTYYEPLAPFIHCLIQPLCKCLEMGVNTIIVSDEILPACMKLCNQALEGIDKTIEEFGKVLDSVIIKYFNVDLQDTARFFDIGTTIIRTMENDTSTSEDSGKKEAISSIGKIIRYANNTIDIIPRWLNHLPIPYMYRRETVIEDLCAIVNLYTNQCLGKDYQHVAQLYKIIDHYKQRTVKKSHIHFELLDQTWTFIKDTLESNWDTIPSDQRDSLSYYYKQQ
ncbi:hypothetical protein DFA_02310 [Cavenderia fasciculata]|uniref:Uncharacterized protein n=1 Tax=Cavenderia fasciculata TaxID=261658 RepID=F4PZ37_CACFS|nr:uncharacterized protein DFA_02310 [Cavenderia fasciculata]EGG19066.1 hypothetical protein DFA_02310 [Cavenderia fasciculata]|eukprot:XP_004366699.1 hypothetical protein DFA_02310 [Cavenderia fasciculata]